MNKYYTRACNFYYGAIARQLISKKLALPLCGDKNIAFDKIEIISRNKVKTNSKIINLRQIKKLNYITKQKVKKDLKNIVSKRTNFLKGVNLLSLVFNRDARTVPGWGG